MTIADPSAQLLTYSPVGWANRLVWDPKKVVQEESSVLKTRVANPSHSIFTNRTSLDDASETKHRNLFKMINWMSNQIEPHQKVKWNDESNYYLRAGWQNPKHEDKIY